MADLWRADVGRRQRTYQAQDAELPPLERKQGKGKHVSKGDGKGDAQQKSSRQRKKEKWLQGGGKFQGPYSRGGDRGYHGY